MELPAPTWEAAPSSPLLTADQVQVWQAALPQTAEEAGPFLPLLSADERERADRFLIPRPRAAFIGARGFLRLIVGRYLDAAPEGLRFGYRPQGKPALADYPALCFNLSHSHGLALYAFSHERQVGVDVERLRPEVASGRIARRFFAPLEVEALDRFGPAQGTEAFFACWTRKEAYLKARGDGLGLGLHRFAVSLGEPATLLYSDLGEAECQRWRLCALHPQPGYLAALCAAAGDWQLRCFGPPVYK